MKPIETVYKGYRFRSRLEARWAVFLDACGVEWEYEPEGYDLGNGLYYLPDFLLHGVAGRSGEDLYVEVKGRMTDEDAEKIKRFADQGNPVLIVGKLPEGDREYDISEDISYRAYQNEKANWPYEFNFETIDGDHFGAHPGINKDGRFELFGDDGSYLCEQDDAATEKAYRIARQARFEHGETPVVRKVVRHGYA